MSKVPPVPVVQAVGLVLKWLGRLRQVATPPPLRLLEVGSMSYFASNALLAAARLGIADTLASGPRTPEEIAEVVNAHPGGVARLLRALVSVGVFEVTRDGRYGLNAAARGLLTGEPGSSRSLLLFAGARWHQLLWAELAQVVRTGRPAHEAVLGKPLFNYLAEHPEDGLEFQQGMLDYSAQTSAACLEVLSFEGVRTVVDVGGGLGQFVSMALDRHPGVKGILFDRPEVVEAARSRTSHLSDRLDIVGGDFFEAVPEGGDLYVLMNVLHDWSDDKAVEILRRCRLAARPGARICAIDMVIPEDVTGSFPALFDLEMLVLFGDGKERTEAELRRLFHDAGLRLSRVSPTASAASILECAVG